MWHCCRSCRRFRDGAAHGDAANRERSPHRVMSAITAAGQQPFARRPTLERQTSPIVSNLAVGAAVLQHELSTCIQFFFLRSKSKSETPISPVEDTGNEQQTAAD